MTTLIQVHQSVVRLFEDVARVVRQHSFRETPGSAYPTGVQAPTKEKVESLSQHVVSVTAELDQNVIFFRLARQRLWPHEPPIWRLWLSQHEYVVGRCRQLMREISGECWSNLPRDDIFDETVRANTLDGLTAEANEALQLVASDGQTETEVSTCELPSVDLVLCQVRFDDECTAVTPDGALLVQKVIEAYPGYFAASSQFSKPAAIKNSLPSRIREHIETAGGKGYRWRPSAGDPAQ